MKIKIGRDSLSHASSKIKLEQNRREIEEKSKEKRVLPITFLTLYKWHDGWEIRGRDKSGAVSLQCESLEEAIIFVKDNI